MNNIFYEMIFKRKSFHIFRNVGNESIGEYELGEIQNAYSEFTPLNPERRFGVLFKEELDREYVYMIRGRSRTVLRGRTRCFFVRNLNGRNWRGKLVERNLVFFYDAARRC